MNNDIIATLLRDRTTERNIIWATTEHAAQEITLEDVPLIVPRHEKNREHQKLRTRARAESLTNSPPFSESANLFGSTNCRIKDWRTGKIFEFVELSGGNRR